MFSDLAPRYDRLNRVLSLGLDQGWRRRTVRLLGLPPGARVLDLCAGTGDLAVAGGRFGWQVHAADFSHAMLAAGRGKGGAAAPRSLVQADATRLPFADGVFDGVTVAFGIRNVAEPRRALAEMRRVLRVGGRLGVLEFFREPPSPWRSAFSAYFRHVLPRLARLAGAPRGDAYDYLPASVEDFATPEEFAAWMRDADFEPRSSRRFAGGVARLWVGRAGVEAGAS